jgi:hypothetical protein
MVATEKWFENRKRIREGGGGGGGGGRDRSLEFVHMRRRKT